MSKYCHILTLYVKASAPSLGWRGGRSALHVSGEQPGEELTAPVRKWRNRQLSPEGVSGGNKAVGPRPKRPKRPKRKKSRADSKGPQFLQRLVRWTDDRQGCLRERHAGRKECPPPGCTAPPETVQGPRGHHGHLHTPRGRI